MCNVIVHARWTSTLPATIHFRSMSDLVLRSSFWTPNMSIWLQEVVSFYRCSYFLGKVFFNIYINLYKTVIYVWLLGLFGKNLSRLKFCGLNLYCKLLIYSGDQVRKHRFLIATKLEKIFLA